VTAEAAKDLSARATALLELRRYEEAFQLASQAIAQQPGEARSHCLAAQALLGLRRHEEAAAAASQAIALAPSWSWPHRLYSAVLGEASKSLRHSQQRAAHERAVSAAREAVRLSPSDRTCHTALAEASARAGQLKEADEAAREAIRLAPHNANVWATASFVALKAKNWRAAEYAAHKALSIDPDNRAATNNLGVAMRAAGRWGQGAVAFAGAASLDPRAPTARDNVALIGYQYLNYLSLFVLLPLLIVPPLFVAARVSVSAALANKPEGLRPLATRLGVKVASKERYRRKFEEAAAQAQKELGAGLAPGGWSALPGRHQASSSVLALVVLLAWVIALVLVAANIGGNGPGVAGWVAAVALAGGSTWLSIALARRRRRLSYWSLGDGSGATRPARSAARSTPAATAAVSARRT
jgi:Flp pilus assembly protein TadD